MARYVWNLSYLAISIIPTVGAARIKPTVSLNCKTKFQPVEATDKKINWFITTTRLSTFMCIEDLTSAQQLKKRRIVVW